MKAAATLERETFLREIHIAPVLMTSNIVFPPPTTTHFHLGLVKSVFDREQCGKRELKNYSVVVVVVVVPNELYARVNYF